LETSWKLTSSPVWVAAFTDSVYENTALWRYTNIY